MKRILKKTGIILSIIITTAITAAYIFIQKPNVKYIFNMSGLLTPSHYNKKEIFINVNNRSVSVMKYRHSIIKSKKYFVLIHGQTTTGNKHEKIDRMAASLCDATGMNVMIPLISTFRVSGVTYKTCTYEIAETYMALVKKFPGKYRAFGACFGATALLGAMSKVPGEIYPEKMFLYGPFADGKKLLELYNKSNIEIDILVKLVISFQMDIYTEKEKELISRAVQTVKPGQTNESEIRQIIGDRLFKDISVVKLSSKDLESVGVDTLFGPGKKIPHCRYFIVHSKNDNIVPYIEGKNLSMYLKKNKADINFLGTELFSHTENKITVTGFINEFMYLMKFFDELFKGDV